MTNSFRESLVEYYQKMIKTGRVSSDGATSKRLKYLKTLPKIKEIENSKHLTSAAKQAILKGIYAGI